MQDLVVLTFMFITRIALPLSLVVGAGYLINRWYSRQEIGETVETAEEQAQAADSGAVAPERKLKIVKRKVA